MRKAAREATKAEEQKAKQRQDIGGGDIECGLWGCFCQCEPSATPTCSDYSTEQTAPADSLAPGWLNINICAWACLKPTIPQDAHLENSNLQPQASLKSSFCSNCLIKIMVSWRSSSKLQLSEVSIVEADMPEKEHEWLTTLITSVLGQR
ncbi:hypothetical protein PAMP_001514 [Pampus punctatissimus]